MMYVLHPRAPMLRIQTEIINNMKVFDFIQIVHLKNMLISDRVNFDMISWKWKYWAQICCLLCSERPDLGFLHNSTLIGIM